MEAFISLLFIAAVVYGGYRYIRYRKSRHADSASTGTGGRAGRPSVQK